MWASRSATTVCTFTRGPSRAFSRSAARTRGALPVFLEPSSPALSQLLADFNAKILLPQHLTKEQQKLVYLEENRAKLDSEPVEITLGDVTLPLQHIDRNRDQPDRSRHIGSIVAQSETKDDWENVVRLLEGLQNARIRVKPGWQEKILRHLNLNGMHHLILKLLQRPSATGVRLNHPKVVLPVLRGVHDQAALADWAQDETTKALRMAKQVVELMDHQDHRSARPQTGVPKDNVATRRDWPSQPVVVALPTEMAAVLADRHGGDVDEVARLANRLVNSLVQDSNTVSLPLFSASLVPPIADALQTHLDAMTARLRRTSDDFTNFTKQITASIAQANDLLELIIIWHALKVSQRVLGARMPMAEEAQKYETRIHGILTQGLSATGNLASRDDKKFNSALVTYVQDAWQRCQ